MRCLSLASLVQTRPIPQGGTAARDELRGASIGVDGACTLVGYTFGDWSGASAGARDWTAVRLDAEGVLQGKWQVVLHGPDHNTKPPGLTALYAPTTYIPSPQNCQLDMPYSCRKSPTEPWNARRSGHRSGRKAPVRAANNNKENTAPQNSSNFPSESPDKHASQPTYFIHGVKNILSLYLVDFP